MGKSDSKLPCSNRLTTYQSSRKAFFMSAVVRYEGKGRSSISCTIVKRIANRMLHALDYSDAELSVLLCDDTVIQHLNFQYRKLDKPTDVLSFSMQEGEPIAGSPLILGDIVISLPTAKKQADMRHSTLLDELTVLLAHGLLHLLGFDHQTASQERIMKAKVDILVATASGKP